MIAMIMAEFIMPKWFLKNWNKSVNGTTEPLTILGTVVATVERILVPNCSAATVTKTAQNPVEKPKNPQYQ